MDRIRVTSTSIISVGYDHNTKTLELEFVNGYINQSKVAFVNTQAKDRYR